jgi:predicted ester cyclase
MDKHRATAERVFELMNAHTLDSLGDSISDRCELVMPGTPPLRGAQALAGVIRGWLSAFPDMKHEIVGYVEEGDRASWQMRVTATHTGTLMTPGGPLAATGRRVRIDAVDFARFEGGKAVSWHVYFDQLSFLQQLGLAPA